MKKKSRAASKKKAKAAGPRAPRARTVAASKSAAPADEQAYIKGLLQRGEAVTLRKGEALPPGATHEVIGHDKDGLAIVRRRRMSAY